MSPILGIMASSRLVASGAYESIATVTVGAGGQSSATFSSIPATYKHLQVRAIARDTSSGNTKFNFNSDVSANYSTHYLVGNGTTASAGAVSSSGFIYVDILTGSGTSYSASITDILDYADTNKFKTTRSLAGIDLNGSGTVWLASGSWRSTVAINRIDIIPDVNVFAQYSTFALYGIKGA